MATQRLMIAAAVLGMTLGAAGCNRQEPAGEVREDVAIAKADGDRKVAKEACEALSGDAQENCKQQAEQQYDLAKAQAQSQLDTARGNGSTDTNDMTPNSGG